MELDCQRESNTQRTTRKFHRKRKSQGISCVTSLGKICGQAWSLPVRGLRTRTQIMKRKTISVAGKFELQKNVQVRFVGILVFEYMHQHVCVAKLGLGFPSEETSIDCNVYMYKVNDPGWDGFVGHRITLLSLKNGLINLYYALCYCILIILTL